MRRCVQMAVLLVFGAIASGQAAAQVPRTDTAVCELPGGHRVELRSRYLWVPVNPHPRSDRTHVDQGNYKARLVPRTGRPVDLEAWHDGQVMDAQVAAGFCAEYGAVGSLVFSPDDLLVLPEQRRVSIKALQALGMASSQRQRSEAHRTLLREHELAYPIGWTFGLGDEGELLAEQGLLSSRKKGMVAAVLRFVSRDSGASWQEQGHFETSILFQLEKRWEQQAFIGRPIRVNGKTIGR